MLRKIERADVSSQPLACWACGSALTLLAALTDVKALREIRTLACADCRREFRHVVGKRGETLIFLQR